MAQLTLSNRILTLTDGAVTSSVDLSTIKGDDGPRGPQGPAGIVTDGTTTLDLSDYYNKTEVDTLISNVDVDLTGYATENYVKQRIAAIDMPTVPTNVSAFTNDAGYLTEHQSLENYYTKTETDSMIGNVDLSNYYTKTETDNKIATELEDVDLSNYYTKTETDALIPDTTGLATESFVAAKIAEAQLSGGGDGSGVDLSGYALKSDIPTKTSQLTNDSNFATKEEVSEAVGGIDLSGYLPKDGSASMTGRLVIQSGDGLWLDDSGSDANLYMNFDRSNNCAAIYSDGDIAFTTFDKRIIAVATPVEGTDVANKNYVDTAITNAIAALDGSEVEY